MIVVVLHKSCTGDGVGKLQTAFLDGKAMLHVFNNCAPNVNEGSLFTEILEPLCRHNESDRWEDEDIRMLQRNLLKNRKPVENVGLEALPNQPKDGAIVVDENGTIVYAAVKLSHNQDLWDLKKIDANGAKVASGTRHQGALATAVWLSNQEKPGIVFVRSDAGGLICFFGKGKLDKPSALEIKAPPQDKRQTVTHLTQTMQMVPTTTGPYGIHTARSAPLIQTVRTS